MALTLTYLQKLLNYLPLTATCGNTEEFIRAALFHQWNDDQLAAYKYNEFANDPEGRWLTNRWTSMDFLVQGTENWVISEYDYTNKREIYKNDEVALQTLTELINTTLIKNGYISIYLEMNLEAHILILCHTDAGLMLVDSYVNSRKSEIRPFDLTSLFDLLKTPTMDKWETICKSGITGLDLSLGGVLNMVLSYIK